MKIFEYWLLSRCGKKNVHNAPIASLLGWWNARLAFRHYRYRSPCTRATGAMRWSRARVTPALTADCRPARRQRRVLAAERKASPSWIFSSISCIQSSQQQKHSFLESVSGIRAGQLLLLRKIYSHEVVNRRPAYQLWNGRTSPTGPAKSPPSPLPQWERLRRSQGVGVGGSQAGGTLWRFNPLILGRSHGSLWISVSGLPLSSDPTRSVIEQQWLSRTQ